MLHQRLLQSVWGKVLRADTADIVSSAEANNASNWHLIGLQISRRQEVQMPPADALECGLPNDALPLRSRPGLNRLINP